jgi:peptidyl-prolyl cis-trans isomerase D
MTKWVVGFIALAMIAFIVGSDLFGSGPRSIFGGNNNVIGEIGGHSVSLEEYQAVVQDRENNYILNFGRQAGEREQPTLRQQAWDLLIAKYAIQPQYEKVGVQVTTDEIWDIVQGKNIDENIKQSFLDSLGKFDRNKLIQYLQSLDAQPANSEARIRWNLFKQSLIPGRERLKYENLIVKTNYVTEAEGERDYHNQNDVAEVKYLYVPFFSVSDSTIKVTDSDLRNYYDKNKKKFKVSLSRSMSYVDIPLVPTPEDSLAIRQELERAKDAFATTTEDSAYAVNNTDGKNAFEKLPTSKLPAFLSSQKENLIKGTVLGPIMDAGSYKLIKIVKVGEDTIGTAKASHILIKWDKDTPEDKKVAKVKATKILNEIKGGADFAAKAREFGTDGTASKGGDLGLITSGQMVKPFEEAVFKAKKIGLINELTETTFGYHIIKVTELINYTAYTIATVERAITPSEATQNEAFRKADTFAGNLSGVEAFKEKAKTENLIVYDANDVSTTERRINNLGEARQMITWLFRDTKVGKVSEVFDLDDSYVVAVMTGETEEGFKPFEKVKEEITPLVKNELKGKAIIEKLNTQKGVLEDIAKAFGTDAAVNTVSDVKLNGNTLGTIGFDPVAVGSAFSLEGGKTTKPFAGENGVFIIEVKNKTVAPAVGDYAVFKNQALQVINGRVAYYVSEAMKDAAKIEDKRYKFY